MHKSRSPILDVQTSSGHLLLPDICDGQLKTKHHLEVDMTVPAARAEASRERIRLAE